MTVGELKQAGLRDDELTMACDGVDPALLSDRNMQYPVNTVWPMGFSWSSTVAQDTMLSLCRLAGINEQAAQYPDYI